MPHKSPHAARAPRAGAMLMPRNDATLPNPAAPAVAGLSEQPKPTGRVPMSRAVASVASTAVVAPSIGAAVSTDSPWLDAATVDAVLHELWRRRRKFIAAGRAADAQYRAARTSEKPRAGTLKDQSWGRVLDVEGKIQALQPASPNLIAALTLIEISHECDMRESIEFQRNGVLAVAVRLLRALRPLLGAGAIAEEVGELLDNPGLPLGVMALWSHSVLLSAAELAAINEQTNARTAEAWRRRDAQFGQAHA